MDEIEYPKVDLNVSIKTLSQWLVMRGLAEELAGYGHASGEEIAEALLEKFNISWKEDPGR